MPDPTQKAPHIRLLESRHPEHQANCAEWRFFQQTLTGGPAYATSDNLFRYPKEETAVYEARLKRAKDHRYNISRLVVDAYVGMLFAKEPTKAESLPPELTRFMEKATREGEDIIALAEDLARNAIGNGIVWACVDKPAYEVDEANPLTLADELEANLLPYAYLVQPTHMLDGRIENGKPTWLLVQEDYRDDADPLNSTFELRHRWRLWTKTEVVLFTPDEQNPDDLTKVLIESRPNKLGAVPFVPFRYGEGCGFSCPGLIADIAHIDRAIFNKLSQIDEIHYAVTFPQLRYPYSGQLVRETETGFERTAEGQMILTVSLDSVIPYDSESGAPDYFAPPVEPAAELDRSVSSMVHRALSLAFMEGEVASMESDGGGKAAASGVSKGYDFEKLNKRIASIAGNIEDGIQALGQLVLLWYGKKVENLPRVLDFPDSFEVRSFSQLIADDIALGGLGIGSKTFAALLKKEMVRRRMPKLKQADLTKIDSEIEEAEEQNEVQRNAMVGDGSLPEDDQADNPDPKDDKPKDDKQTED